MPLRVCTVSSSIKLILSIGAASLVADKQTYAAHSGAECYLNGHQIYIPDGLNYPRHAWAGWGISCNTPKKETSAGSGAPD
jgi:hypothetical protein